MTGMRQAWLVAARELRERSRSRAFLASVVIMIVVLVAVIVLPALLVRADTKNIGVAGSVPSALPATITAHAHAAGTKTRIRTYNTISAGQQATRKGTLDVLVVNGRRLEWRGRTDQQLRTLVTGAIQLVAVRDRAAAAGISTQTLATVLAPVSVTNVEMGRVAGRSASDEAAASIITIVLLMAISTFGGLVLSGVVEEKSSRVVEVLLARVPARTLLAGKIVGIGLLGLAQIVVTALAALAATMTVHSVDLPAVRGSVLTWAIVWFVLGYALYATLFGALGSLASRPEDAQSVAGPVTAVLIAGYFASFAAMGSPDTAWARAVSLFPATAPMAMPNRIAMGVATWWEPILAVALTLITLAGLISFAGRVYPAAVLHTGATLKLRTVWRTTRTPGRTLPTADAHSRSPAATHHPATARWMSGPTAGVVYIVMAAAGGLTVGLLTHDVIIGVAVGAAAFAIADRVRKARHRPRSPRPPR